MADTALDVSPRDAALDTISPDVAVACNSLILDAPAAEVTFRKEAAPKPLGGTIVDGTYFLTAVVGYGMDGPKVSAGRTKIVVAGGVWQQIESVDDAPGGVNPDRQSTHTVTLSGTSLSDRRTCPASTKTNDGQFTADATGFTIFVTDRGVTFTSVFTKK